MPQWLYVALWIVWFTWTFLIVTHTALGVYLKKISFDNVDSAKLTVYLIISILWLCYAFLGRT